MIKGGKYTQIFEQNKKGRDFVIGDIHGHKKRFLRALKSVGFDKTKDRLFALGDLIDRGSDNLFILNCLRTEDWFFSLRGNHEQMIINRYDFPSIKPAYGSNIQTRRDAAANHSLNGGKWFDKLHSSLAKHRIYKNLSALPYAITLQTEFGDIGLVHAEVPEQFDSWNEFLTALDSSSNVREEAIWNCLAIESIYHLESGKYWEEEFQDEPRFVEDITLTVHGHSTSHEPIICGNQVWIDTGYRKGELTILEVSKLVDIVKEEP